MDKGPHEVSQNPRRWYNTRHLSTPTHTHLVCPVHPAPFWPSLQGVPPVWVQGCCAMRCHVVMYCTCGNSQPLPHFTRDPQTRWGERGGEERDQKTTGQAGPGRKADGLTLCTHTTHIQYTQHTRSPFGISVLAALSWRGPGYHMRVACSMHRVRAGGPCCHALPWSRGFSSPGRSFSLFEPLVGVSKVSVRRGCAPIPSIDFSFLLCARYLAARCAPGTPSMCGAGDKRPEMDGGIACFLMPPKSPGIE